jgi:hypothetical protein
MRFSSLSGEILFGNVLHGFSLAAPFSNGAIPALVGASRPNEKGGSARFGSINQVFLGPGDRESIVAGTSFRDPKHGAESVEPRQVGSGRESPFLRP